MVKRKGVDYNGQASDVIEEFIKSFKTERRRAGVSEK